MSWTLDLEVPSRYILSLKYLSRCGQDSLFIAHANVSITVKLNSIVHKVTYNHR
jgi:hypothetical protein